jgi:hypothetical protein
MMTRAEWMAWLRESWAEAQGVAARGCSKGLHQAQGVAASCSKGLHQAQDHTIKTWQERCEEHPDHEGIVTEQMIRNRMQEEIDELRQALEEKREPVGYFSVNDYGRWEENEGTYGEPLYTAPPKQWVGLTDEEVSEIIDREIGFNSCWGPEEKFARAIEQALKEKNT